MASVHAVIMAGGAGTRFWPASRVSRPKYLLPLCGGEPMIRATVQRARAVCAAEHVWIVTNATQREAILAAVPGFPEANLLIEPEARDTAPCVALALAAVTARDEGATLLVLPADQTIEPTDAFVEMARRGADLAADGESIVTFGVAPSYAATGYGYIALGAPRDEAAPRAFDVEGFREKPDAETARRFVEEGRFWWNSGILMFCASAMRAQMQRHCPELSNAEGEMRAAIAADDDSALARAFEAAPRTSIDFAVMERADRLAVVECTADWDDLGGFPALARALEADADGNHRSLHDGADAVTVGSSGNVVYAEGRRTVALLGVEDMVVATVGDAVLVCPKARADELKQLIQALKAKGREDLL
jgi:mannose-1-phosphate guanylyltransferase